MSSTQDLGGGPARDRGVRVKLSSPQRVALQQVTNGKVTYGDPAPNMTRRIAKSQGGTTYREITGEEKQRPTSVRAYASFSWLIHGHEAYGQQARTFASLEKAGLIVVHYDEFPPDDTGVVRVTLAEPSETSSGEPVGGGE